MRLACFRLLFCGLIWLVSVGDSFAQLFPAGMNPGKYPELYSFMERYARMLLSLETSREQARQMQEDGVRLRVGGVDFRDTGESFSAVYQRIHQTKAFTLTVDSLYFKAAWGYEGGTDEIAFLFPKKYDLILGKDKKELTQGFLSELMAEYPEAETYPYPILHDSGFYWLESVRSGWFPEAGKSDGYLFDIDRKEDSLLNLFSYDILGKAVAVPGDAVPAVGFGNGSDVAGFVIFGTGAKIKHLAKEVAASLQIIEHPQILLQFGERGRCREIFGVAADRGMDNDIRLKLFEILLHL